MGHKRLGELPNTGAWKRFKKALAEEEYAPTLAQTALRALGKHLVKLGSDPGLVYSFWMLTIRWTPCGAVCLSRLMYPL